MIDRHGNASNLFKFCDHFSLFSTKSDGITVLCLQPQLNHVTNDNSHTQARGFVACDTPKAFTPKIQESVSVDPKLVTQYKSPSLDDPICFHFEHTQLKAVCRSKLFFPSFFQFKPPCFNTPPFFIFLSPPPHSSRPTPPLSTCTRTARPTTSLACAWQSFRTQPTWPTCC